MFKYPLASVKKGLAAGIVTCTFFMAGCTEPGETTSLGAATGGVMGAGLGAIIGSQTGSPGAGIAIGAVAGSGAGALIGNSLEAQQKVVRSQDEAIARQQRTIESQQRELEEMRRSGETPRAAPRIVERTARAAASRPRTLTSEQLRIKEAYARAHPLREGETLSNRKIAARKEIVAQKETLKPARRIVVADARPTIKQQQIPPKILETPTPDEAEGEIAEVSEPAHKEGSKGAFDWTAVKRAVTEEAPVKEKDLTVSDTKQDDVVADDVVVKVAPTGDCAQAATEIQSGENAQSSPDKLFHYRRALRLCPKNPEYHTKLGDVYVSLNRPSDAAYEFKEALSADPSYVEAKEKLATVQRY